MLGELYVSKAALAKTTKHLSAINYFVKALKIAQKVLPANAIDVLKIKAKIKALLK